MAINKSRTSPFMKTMIIILAVSFVLGIGGFAGAGLSSCTASAPLLPGSSSASTAGSTDTSAAISAINLRFTPRLAAREASITADPKNYDLLTAQGDDYYDWASQVSQVTKTITTDSEQLWANAATYYKRALAVKPGDPNVATDCSIALFYGGSADEAITLAEKTRTENPTFSPVVFNLGIFYASAGTTEGNVKATAAFQAYLKMDPNGANAANAKQYITELGSTATTSTGQ